MHRLCLLLCLLCPFLPFRTVSAQQLVPSLARMEGLRSHGFVGSFKAAAYLPDGAVVLLYNQGDGLRLIKSDATASSVLAQAHLGAAGDTGIALRVDAQGSIFVGGTSSSGALTGTGGAVYPAPADASLNSFLARFDSDLKPSFLTFLGAGRTALSGISVTADAVFATGVTYSAALPTTSGALLPSPPPDTTGNGFVERLSLDGTTLQYATYLGGGGGSTTPTGIVADTFDNAFIVGSTSSPAYPVMSALQPVMMGVVSGFLSKLAPAGDILGFSTFLAGAGLSDVALSADARTLLLTGNVDPAGFPVARVSGPVVATAYQSLVRLSADSGTWQDAALLFPGTQSAVAAGSANDVWITGTLTVPLGEREQNAGLGESYALHLSAADTIDGAVRLGGTPTNNLGYVSLTSVLGPPGLSSSGNTILLPGTVSLSTDPAVASAQSFAFDLTSGSTALLPETTTDLRPTTCVSGQPCTGSGAFLAQLTAPRGQPVLTVSSGDLPLLTIRNRGTVSTSGLLILSDVYSVSTNCPQALSPGAQCGALLGGSGEGTITLLGTNLAAQSFTLASLPLPRSAPLTLSDTELDFGIVTAASPLSRSFAVANLGASTQTFASSAEDIPSSAPYVLAETSTTCAGPPAAHILSPGDSCTIAVTLKASATEGNDSLVQAAWKIGSRDLLVTGFAQASSLAASSKEIAFGAQTSAPSARLPRFLYLSNASPTPITHTALTLPPDSPFVLSDQCPSTLQPASVCRIELTYVQTAAPALDSTTLTLDDGLTVLVMGSTLSAPVPSRSLPASPFLVSTSAVQFAAPVSVTGVSTETHVVQITNTSSGTQPLADTLLGDYTLTGTCGTTLQAGASCVVVLHFAPSQIGLREGLLTVSAGSAILPVTVSLSGTGTPLALNGGRRLGPRRDHGRRTLGPLDPGTKFPAPAHGLCNSNLLRRRHFCRTAATVTASCLLPPSRKPPRHPASTAGLASSSGHKRQVLQLDGSNVSTDANGNPEQISLHGTALPGQGLLLTPTQVSFGAVPVNSASAPVSLTFSNLVSSDQTVTIQSLGVTGDFSLSPVVAGCTGSIATAASCALSVTFAPTTTGVRSGTLTIITSAGTVVSALGGTGTPDQGLSFSPSMLAFAQTGSQTITVRNTGSSALQLGIPTSSSPAFIPSTACATLSPSQSCEMAVAYTPQLSSSTGSLTVPVTYEDASGQNTQTVYALQLTSSLTEATAALSIFPAQADFGTADVQTAGKLRQFTLTNTATTAVSIDLAASRNFPLAGLPECATLAAGASCTFSVIFLPQTAGALTGSVIATATAPDGNLGGPERRESAGLRDGSRKALRLGRQRTGVLTDLRPGRLGRKRNQDGHPEQHRQHRRDDPAAQQHSPLSGRRQLCGAPGGCLLHRYHHLRTGLPGLNQRLTAATLRSRHPAHRKRRRHKPQYGLPQRVRRPLNSVHAGNGRTADLHALPLCGHLSGYGLRHRVVAAGCHAPQHGIGAPSPSQQ